MRAMFKKLKKNKSGFSLAEMLIAVLILLMASAIVAGAIPAASSAYMKVVDTANAQVLLSTTMTVLRDELSTAADIEKGEDGTTITYRSANNGYCQIGIVDEDAAAAAAASTGTDFKKTKPGIWITYLKYDPITGKKEVDAAKKPRLLVSAEAATYSEKSKMWVSYGIDEINDETIKLTGIKVYRNGKEISVASRDSYTIRLVTNVDVKKPTVVTTNTNTDTTP